MSTRSNPGRPRSGQPSKLWLGGVASVVLHALPLSFALPVIVQRALPLRGADVQVEVLHEVTAREAAVPATSAAAEAAPTEPPAAPAATVVRRREAAKPAPVSPPVSASPAPAQPAAFSEPAASAPDERVAAASSLTEVSPATEPSAAEPAAAAPVQVGASAAGVGAGTGVAKGVGSSASASASAAVRGAPGLDVAALRGRYLGQLRARVLARREYPRLARRAGLEGTVCLRIVVDAAGRLAQLRPTCAAPAPLVEAALSAVRASAPFGPLPSGLGSELILDLPMVFQLDAG